MSSTYKVNFKELRQENLKETFVSFERALNHVDIDFYLIGAIARDTWFAQKGIRALGTTDIDFAVLISDPEKFITLKQFMISNEDFRESSNNEYVLFDKSGFQIDLIPFGSLEIEGKEIIDKEGLIHANVTGFKEVYEEAIEEVSFEGKYKFNVATLAGIVILKLISYDDRPEMRSQDIKDIGVIINHFFDLERNAIYENHLDLLVENDDLRKISARVLGRQMRAVLNRNILLKERVLKILNQNIVPLNNTRTSYLFENESPIDIEYQTQIMQEIILGINDEIQ
jgi:predicted nucleotidyltransferase